MHKMEEKMRDVLDEDLNAAARGLGIGVMTDKQLEDLCVQHAERYDGMFASRVIFHATLRELRSRVQRPMRGSR